MELDLYPTFSTSDISESSEEVDSPENDILKEVISETCTSGLDIVVLGILNSSLLEYAFVPPIEIRTEVPNTSELKSLRTISLEESSESLPIKYPEASPVIERVLFVNPKGLSISPRSGYDIGLAPLDMLIDKFVIGKSGKDLYA